MTIKLIVADDHQLFRAGLTRMLADLPDIEVVAEANDGEETLALLAHVEADVLTLDLTMPGMTGVPLIEKIHALKPTLPILILSMHDEPATIRRVLKSGAMGYITKSAAPEVLHAAINSVHAGVPYVDPSLAVSLALNLEEEPKQAVALSKREQEVLYLITQGLPLIEIAERLFVSPKTVTTHKTNLMEKLKVKNNTELIRYALENHLFN
ncbi:MAG TPA: response regulator transcription factor [Rhodocyclaceae bacterium]|nr:response regulator transcription factor [Rhodocyclaceae bacterium]